MKQNNKKLSLKYKAKLPENTRNRARTLQAINGFIEKTGWTIDGIIHEDWYKWINDFDATHPKYGRVCGNFELEVKASSATAYKQFIKDHPYEEWYYGDI